MARLAAWLDVRLPALAVSQPVEFAVRLCLEEAVQNVVMHGGPGATTIKIWLDRLEGGLEAVVEDDGPEFDPLSQRSRPPPASLQEAEPGGLGIAMMREFASALRFCRGGGVNRLAFEFRSCAH